MLAVTRELSVSDVLQVIVRSVRSLAGARYAALGVPDDRGSFAEFVVDGISERWRKAIGPLPRQHGMLGVILREGQPLRLADIRADARFEGWPSAHPELADILAMPIKDGDQVLGFIFAANKMAGGGFTERDEEVLALFAAHAAIALTNARLYERARQLSVLEERARLARDLHDAVTQKLFSIRVKARAASVLASRDPATGDTDRAAAEMASVAALAGDAQAELRAVIDGLAPPEITEGGLAGSLRRYALLAGAGRGPGGRAVPDRAGSAAQRAAPLRHGRGQRVGVRGGQAGHPGGQRPGQGFRTGTGHRRPWPAVAAGKGRRGRCLAGDPLRSGAGHHGAGGHAGRPRRARGAAVSASAAGKITVLIADDHPVVRQGLRVLLSLHPDIEVVGEAGDGARPEAARPGRAGRAGRTQGPEPAGQSARAHQRG